MQSPECQAAQLTAARFLLPRHKYPIALEAISVTENGAILCSRRLRNRDRVPIALLAGIILERVESPEVQEAFTKRALYGFPRQTEQVLRVIDLHWDDLMADYRSCLQRYVSAPAHSTEIEGVT
jgi:hypothetical protein